MTTLKRTTTAAGFSPAPINSKQQMLDTLTEKLELMDKTTVGMNEMMECAQTPAEVKTVFTSLLLILDTCRATINELRKERVDNSAEEMERRRSLVFVGLPESNAAKPSDRIKQDAATVETILDELGVEATPAACYRMGRVDQARTGGRPLKIVLPASVFQHIALGGWKRNRERLRATPQFARLWVRPSLTKAQLESEWQARMARRNRGGTMAQNGTGANASSGN